MYCKKCEFIDKNCLISLLLSLAVLIMAIIALMLFIKNKKIKEEKEIDDYLENSIR